MSHDGETEGKSSSSPLSEVISDGRFVEALALEEELRNVVAGVLQQVVLDQEQDPLGKRRGPGSLPASENMWDKLLKNRNNFFHIPFWGPC